MKHTRSDVHLGRRTFFGIAATTFAGLAAGSAIVKKIFHAPTPRQEDAMKVNIRINPLAVPRSKKGRSANG